MVTNIRLKANVGHPRNVTKRTENRGKIKNSSNVNGTYEFRSVLRRFPADPSVEVTNTHTARRHSKKYYFFIQEAEKV
jgi:hypothetical protein